MYCTPSAHFVYFSEICKDYRFGEYIGMLPITPKCTLIEAPFYKWIVSVSFMPLNPCGAMGGVF